MYLPRFLLRTVVVVTALAPARVLSLLSAPLAFCKLYRNYYNFISPTSHKSVKLFESFADIDGDNEDASECDVSGLWSTAGETAARCLPQEPDKCLSADEVIAAVIRGLQYNDVPENNSGLRRCYEFMDLPCKKLVTGIGNIPEERTLEKFIEYAAKSPKLTPFIGTRFIEFGPLSRIAPTNTRGEIVTMPLKVRAQFHPEVYTSGFERTGEPPVQTFTIRLQKQRRPPLQGAYLVTDLVDVQTVTSISRPLSRE